jgi:predicted dienelactone hydrolase
MPKSFALVFLLFLGCSGDPADTDETPEPLVETTGCDSNPFYERSSDPAARGPWAVGVQTVQLGRLDVEVLYPAEPGSEAGASPMEVDIRYALPESERSKVSDAANPHQSCDCYPDLPLDETHGPYPLVLFVHGTASWRTQSLSLMEHWASRGFVVASADHPGLWLSDLLGSLCSQPTTGSQDLMGDLETVLDGFRNQDPALDFLGDRVDTSRVAVSGHSAGASAALAAADLAGVQVVIGMAGGGSTEVSELKSALFLGGMADTVVPFSQTQAAYEASTPARRLVGIADGGHLIFSDICELTNDDGENLVEIATEAGVCGTEFAAFLFDCAASTIPAADANAIIRSTSTWELETHLHCDERLEAFEAFGAQSEWVDVLESAAAQ